MIGWIQLFYQREREGLANLEILKIFLFAKKIFRSS